MPGFDLKEFPLVVGVNDDRSHLLLVNLLTEEITCISRILKTNEYDWISDLMVTYKPDNK